MYFNVQIFVNLDGFAEGKDELAQAGKFPHIPNLLEDR